MRERAAWQWKEFKDVATRRLPKRLYATLSPAKGEFVINVTTFEALNEPEAVVLLYDPDDRTIGVKPSRVEVPNAVLIHTRHARYNKVFRSKPFLQANHIEIERTIQFPTAEIDRSGVLILKLRESVAATHMPKRQGGQFK